MSQKGAIVEYAILIALLAAAITVAVASNGKEIRDLFCDMSFGFEKDAAYSRGNSSWSDEAGCCVLLWDLEYCDEEAMIALGETCPSESPAICQN